METRRLVRSCGSKTGSGDRPTGNPFYPQHIAALLPTLKFERQPRRRSHRQFLLGLDRALQRRGIHSTAVDVDAVVVVRQVEQFPVEREFPALESPALVAAKIKPHICRKPNGIK